MKFDLFQNDSRVLLRKLIVFYSAIGSSVPSINLPHEKLDKINQYRIKTDLLPVLRNKERFDLIEAKVCVLNWLEELLQLDSGEIAFLDAFSRQIYRPELLFNSKDILDRIKTHPMALWKCSQKV